MSAIPIVSRLAILETVAFYMVFDCEAGMEAAVQATAEAYCLPVEAVWDCIPVSTWAVVH